MNIVDSSGWLAYFADEPNAKHFLAPLSDPLACCPRGDNIRGFQGDSSGIRRERRAACGHGHAEGHRRGSDRIFGDRRIKAESGT